MAVPIKYNMRNLFVRWRLTLATMLGIALVVAVFVLVMALARGLKSTYINTGDPRNLLVLRKGSTSESSSQIGLEQVRRIRYIDEIAQIDAGDGAKPLMSAEVIVLINLERVNNGGTANVLMRGMEPLGLELRPHIKLVEGRMFRPGLRECIVSRKIADRFADCQVGQTFRTGKTYWNVVGIFDASKTAFESEIWVDANEAREVFHRDFYGSIVMRMADPSVCALFRERDRLEAGLKELERQLEDAERQTPSRLKQWLGSMMTDPVVAARQVGEQLAAVTRQLESTVIGRLEADRQLRVRVIPESEYYREQTKTAGLFQFMGGFLASIMSVGAAFSAMNTMYAAVGARTREIGTLRAIGYRRRDIYLSFIIESVLLGAMGGVLGCLLALPLNGFAMGTFSWTTFSEVAFEFRITPELMGKGLIFAVVMGLLGGILPARLAARKTVLDALRST